MAAAAIFSGLSLSGCGSAGQSGSLSSSLGFGSTYEQVKGKFKTSAEARVETRSKRRPENKSATVLAFSGEPAKPTLMAVGQDLGFVRVPHAEAYMRRILNRLAAKWPYEAPQVGVFVKASNEFSASATASDIIVSLAVFEGLESEDQLAAILAHEFSHIALRHHEQIDQRRALTKGVTVASSAASAMAYASEVKFARNGAGQVQVSVRDAKAADNRALYVSAAQLALNTLVNDLVGPGWNRTQESEADLLGVDLLEAAGYDGRAMIEVLRKLAAGEKAKQQEIEVFSKNYGPEIAQAAASMNTGSILGVAKDAALDAGSTALSAIGEKLRRDHPDAEGRIKDVQGYLNREYRDALHDEMKAEYAAQYRLIKPAREIYRPAFEANDALRDKRLADAKNAIDRALAGPARNTAAVRFVAYSVAVQSGDAQGASRHLLAIQNWNDAPVAAYAALAQHHAMQRRVSEGENLLKRAELRFGSSEILLPSRVGMYRAANRKPEMEAQLVACRKLDDSDIRKSCEDAGQSADVAVAKKEEVESNSLFNSGNKSLLGKLTSGIGI